MGILREISGLLTPWRSAAAKHTQSHTHRRRGQWPTPLLEILGTGMVLLMTLTADAGTARTFAAADLEGTWNFHGLVSGHPDDFQSWVYGTMTCDSKGVFTGRTTTRTGETSPRTGMFEISPLGIVTMRGATGPERSFHGVMNNNKDTIVSTMNDGGGGYSLLLYTKSVGTLAISDLKGTWVFHGLISNTVSDPAPRWWYGSSTMDERGNVFFSSPIVDSWGDIEIPRPGKFRVTEGDVLVPDSFDMAIQHGTVNQSKDMMVSVATVFVRSIEEVGWDIPGDILCVSEKQVPGAYSTGDLAGTWYLHTLTSSSSYDDAVGWGHATMLIDRHGNANFVTGSFLDSWGDTDNTWSGTMNMTSDGIVTMSNVPTFHGIMNLGKDMWVGTMDDGGGGYGLVIGVGRPPIDEFDFNADGRVDFIDLANFASHWLN